MDFPHKLGHRKRGICIKTSENCILVCDNFAHLSSDVPNEIPAILRKFGAQFAPNLRNSPLPKTPLLRTSDFLPPLSWDGKIIAESFCGLSVREASRDKCQSITQKNPRAHKNKIGTPSPKKTQIPPPPKTRNFVDMGFLLQKERICPGVHKIDAPISGPRIADKNFTGTRVFLKYLLLERLIKQTIWSSHFFARASLLRCQTLQVSFSCVSSDLVSKQFGSVFKQLGFGLQTALFACHLRLLTIHARRHLAGKAEHGEFTRVLRRYRSFCLLKRTLTPRTTPLEGYFAS